MPNPKIDFAARVASLPDVPPSIIMEAKQIEAQTLMINELIAALEVKQKHLTRKLYSRYSAAELSHAGIHLGLL